jgi:hypothetical protein
MTWDPLEVITILSLGVKLLMSLAKRMQLLEDAITELASEPTTAHDAFVILDITEQDVIERLRQRCSNRVLTSSMLCPSIPIPIEPTSNSCSEPETNTENYSELHPNTLENIPSWKSRTRNFDSDST